MILFRQADEVLPDFPMMKVGKEAGLIGGIALMAGFALGWLFKPKEAEVVEIQEEKKSRTRVVPGRTPTGSAGNHATTSFNGAGNDDFQAKIETLMGGLWEPFGRSEREADEVRKLMSAWAVSDLDSAIAWAKKCSHIVQQDFAYMGIIDGVRMSDHEQAMEIWGQWQYERNWQKDGYLITVNKSFFLSDFLQQISFHGDEIGVRKVVQTLEKYPEDSQRRTAAIEVEKLLLETLATPISPEVAEAMQEMAELTRQLPPSVKEVLGK